MTQGIRLMPFAVLERRYLRGGRVVMGGFYWDAEALEGLRPGELATQLGLDWQQPDGAPAFPPGERLGYLSFPITAEVERASIAACTASAGGLEPDPSLTVSFTGTGFAPGPRRIAEYRLDRIALPGGSEIGRISASGHRIVVARWRGKQWVRQ